MGGRSIARPVPCVLKTRSSASRAASSTDLPLAWALENPLNQVAILTVLSASLSIEKYVSDAFFPMVVRVPKELRSVISDPAALTAGEIPLT